MSELDILACGAHPDDVELGAGGSLARHSALGYRVGILDLTRGELANNGTAEERDGEARAAGRVLGVSVRLNLGLPDRGIRPTEAAIAAAVAVIRKYRPRVLLVPYGRDAHPDHRAAYVLLEEARFSAALSKLEGDHPPYRVPVLLQYFINNDEPPDVIVPTEGYMERKMEAIRAHRSQFLYEPGRVRTPLNDGSLLRKIVARDRYFGSLIGSESAEGFLWGAPRRTEDLLDLVDKGGR